MPKFQDYQIRMMLPADIETVCSIEKQIFSDPWLPGTYLRALSLPNALWYILEASTDLSSGYHQIIGYIGGISVLDEAEIYRIAITPELQRQGFASQILHYFLEMCIVKGINAVTLEVRSKNTAAIALYQSFGFIMEGLRKRYYKKPEDDALIMWWRKG